MCNFNSDKFLILQTVAPDYRRKFFDVLHISLKENFVLYAGLDYFENSVKTDKSIKYLKKAKNFYFFNRSCLFQFGMWYEALKAKKLVLELNPRILSNWLLLFLRRIFKKQTILWGHAWPVSGQYSRTEIIRNIMRIMADIVITYTPKQAQDLQEKMKKKKILVASNALYFKKEMCVFESQDINDIIYVGRLTHRKKPLILLKAFHRIIKELPEKTKLVIIGDGPERNKLVKLVDKFRLNDRVNVLGHVGDYEILAEYYKHALFSVSPGYVGLSITQSFGFGVPMLISEKEHHSPEIDAARLGFNSKFFITDDIDDLAFNILDFYTQKKDWIKQRKLINEECKDLYSIESMTKTFLNIAADNI